jgi:aminobenzoyl-glutamate utilization protein B
LAAALALKHHIEQTGATGTVRYIGCPAAENGSGKVFLARSGLFDDVDAALTWHPFNSTSVMTFNVLATIGVRFAFHGVSAHASGTPHLGRSALDAVELMNVGVNFLREHVEQDARMHYAITDAGGSSPNIVQAKASVLYQLRAPRLSQVRDIYERVVKIAQGAAMMTGTRVETVFEKASSNMLLNHTLGALAHQTLTALGSVPYNEADLTFAKAMRGGLSDKECRFDESAAAILFGSSGREMADRMCGKDIVAEIFPYRPEGIVGTGSNDLGDVSWNAPTVCLHTTTFAKDTQPHGWRLTSQGKSALCHKGMLHAGKAMALVGAALLEQPAQLAAARAEFKEQRAGEKYLSPIPPDVQPPQLQESR